MATQEIVRPDIAPAKTRGAAQSRADAGAIAKAAIHHLKGDLAGALACLEEVGAALETADLLRARGYIQLELADFAAAERSYASAAEKEPVCVENWFQWGYCLHKLGELAEALKAFEKAAALGTNWIEVPLAKSICQLGLKQYEKSIEEAESCLKVDVAYVPALFTKAVALHLTWNLDQACELYEHVLQLDETCVQARMNLITAGIQRRRYDLVNTHAQKLADSDPTHLLAREGLAVSAFSFQEFKKARAEYTRLTELAPTQVEHWLNLGITLLKQTELDEARKCFTRAREIRPDSLHAHIHLAETCWDLEDLAAARSCYEDAVAKWPDREELTLSLSHVLEEMELLELAGKVCEQYCERKSDKEEVWFRLGYVRWKQNQAEASTTSFERAIGIRADWPEAEVNLALTLIATERLDVATKTLKALLERVPDHLEASKGLATIALKENDDAKALELHLRLLELGEKTADVYYNCGVLAHNLDHVDDAVRFYREAIALRKNFPEALLNLGHALKVIGDDDQARSLWIPALELNPELSLNYFRRG